MLCVRLCAENGLCVCVRALAGVGCMHSLAKCQRQQCEFANGRQKFTAQKLLLLLCTQLCRAIEAAADGCDIHTVSVRIFSLTLSAIAHIHTNTSASKMHRHRHTHTHTQHICIGHFDAPVGVTDWIRSVSCRLLINS